MSEEIPLEVAEFSESEQEIKALIEEEAAFVPYVPKSKGPELGTLIPRNIAFEVRKSLNRVSTLKGDIDAYVSNQLRYTSKQQLYKALGAEQIDALGLYLLQFEKNLGIVIADDTGVGKGRQAAAVIRHAIMNDCIPVFLTKDSSLFSDIYRDLVDIDFNQVKPFIINTDDKASVKDQQGNVIFHRMSSKDQKEKLITKRKVATDSADSVKWHEDRGIPLPDPDEKPTIEIHQVIDYLPNQYNCVFSTYKQIERGGAHKRVWLANMTTSGVEGSQKYKPVVYILDECHLIGGYKTIAGTWARNILPHSKAACFLSGTSAKDPSVLLLYAKKTSMQEAQLADDVFIRGMNRGGLALQELMPPNLAESGQLIKRQRPSDGILYHYHVEDREPRRSINRKKIDKIISLMQQIIEFEREYILPYLHEINLKAKEEGERADKTFKSLGVRHSPYFSKIFNITDQLIFALKVEEAAQYAIDLLNQDKKVVIAFRSTMGAFMEQLGFSTGDIVEPSKLDFSQTLQRSLDGLFKYKFTSVLGEKSDRVIEITDLPRAAFQTYKSLRDSILYESSRLTISPIDVLIDRIEKASKSAALGGHSGPNFKTTEITGRSQRFDLSGENVTVKSRRNAPGKSFREFNEGKVDVLLLNQSGSTGFSAHASSKFKDQRQRAMIILQLELDINILVQMLGRINRTGQVVPPEYHFFMSDIPIETRMLTMMKGKLKKLDANSTGSQNTNDNILDTPDLFNKYGDFAALQWVNEHSFLAEQVGYEKYTESVDKDGIKKKERAIPHGLLRQLTGRAILFTVKYQEELFSDLINKYNREIQYAKQQGTYDLEIAFLPLDGEVKRRFVFKQGTGGVTAFGRDVIREETIINNLDKPFTVKEINERIVETLAARTNDEFQTRQVTKVDTEYAAVKERLMSRRQESIDNTETELNQLAEAGSLETEEENKRLAKDRARLEEILKEKRTGLETYAKELDQIKDNLIKYLLYWKVGEVVRVPILGENSVSWGIFLGARIPDAKNPFTQSNVTFVFAVADFRKTVVYNLTPEQKANLAHIYAESRDIGDVQATEVLQSWNEIIKDSSQKRVKRHILTGNILAASDKIGTINRLIKYNVGRTIQSGILLNPSFGENEQELKALMPINNALELILNLEKDIIFADHQLRIKFRVATDKAFELLVNKKHGYDIYTNERIRSLLLRPANSDELGEFEQVSREMVAYIARDKMKALLEILAQLNVLYLGEAQQLETYELDNEEDWQQRTTEDHHVYILTKPFGQGTHPSTGFLEFLSETAEYPYGRVSFNRKLETLERVSYDLVPFFKNPEQPYQQWLATIEKDQTILDEWEKTLDKARAMELSEAYLTLGYFITNHTHENADTRYVFGKYLEEELGEVAYRMLDENPLSKILNQLTIELAA